MAERQPTKPEIASQKRVVKLPPAIGDWTTYRPSKALIKRIKTGLYGFDRLSRNELNQTLIIHYRFIQELLKFFKINLGMGVELFSYQVEQTTYLNFLRTIGGPAVQGKLSLPDLHENILVFFDSNIAHSIINHAVGSRDLELINRGLTETENTVFSTALTECLAGYASSFEGAIETPAFSLVGSEEVTLDPSINTSATFVAFSAEACLNENPPGKIIFGYLGGTLKKLLSQYEKKVESRPLNFSKLPPATLSKILVPVSATIGTTSLLTSELHALETGDVVSLGASINSAITLTLGRFLKLPAQPGISNKKRAARIAGFGEEEMQVAPPLALHAEKPPEKNLEEKIEGKTAEAAPPVEEKFPPEEEEFTEEELFPKEEEEEAAATEEDILKEEEEFTE
ncbi:FliM/FliN family flagellar motor switch protein [Candidatus Saganbacteria bacterium]|uniref:Flagellar motor switch protein FliM n=1 Tax=Candidatus Saganbacteria bacterium TaxID=2575572 RepID=A0A9D6UMP5_UNCSA|nr:FliM/FliN family flagellar motor switch protein [Candidatus Saganbacteria bacterium]